MLTSRGDEVLARTLSTEALLLRYTTTDGVAFLRRCQMDGISVAGAGELPPNEFLVRGADLGL